jgi:hypothetical protein
VDVVAETETLDATTKSTLAAPVVTACTEAEPGRFFNTPRAAFPIVAVPVVPAKALSGMSRTNSEEVRCVANTLAPRFFETPTAAVTLAEEETEPPIGLATPSAPLTEAEDDMFPVSCWKNVRFGLLTFPDTETLAASGADLLTLPVVDAEVLTEDCSPAVFDRLGVEAADAVADPARGATLFAAAVVAAVTLKLLAMPFDTPRLPELDAEALMEPLAGKATVTAAETVADVLITAAIGLVSDRPPAIEAEAETEEATGFATPSAAVVDTSPDTEAATGLFVVRDAEVFADTDPAAPSWTSTAGVPFKTTSLNR